MGNDVDRTARAAPAPILGFDMKNATPLVSQEDEGRAQRRQYLRALVKYMGFASYAHPTSLCL